MLHENGIQRNGHTLHCDSDYEEDPAYDAPMPGWRNQFPRFTHNVSWVDSDSKQHSMTIRTDDADELFGILKAVKHIVRQSKETAAKSQPETPADTPAEPDVIHCHIHGVDMPRRYSKRTGGHYFGHKTDDGNFCYGKAK